MFPFYRIDQSIGKLVNIALPTRMIMQQNHFFLTLILTQIKIPSESQKNRSPVHYEACCVSFEKDT